MKNYLHKLNLPTHVEIWWLSELEKKPARITLQYFTAMRDDTWYYMEHNFFHTEAQAQDYVDEMAKMLTDDLTMI